MDNETLNKLDNILKDIRDSKESKDIVRVKSILLNNKELLKSIDNLKNSEYSKEYVDTKKELLDNKDLKTYKELEFEFIKFSNSVSKKLSSVTK